MVLSFDKSTVRLNLSVTRKGFDKRSDIILDVVVRNQYSNYMYDVHTLLTLEECIYTKVVLEIKTVRSPRPKPRASLGSEGDFRPKNHTDT
jgi:hypothetical protein